MDNLKGLKRTHYCGDLRISNVGEEVVLNGWVQKKRNLGGLVFVDLRDIKGITQILFDTNVSEEAFNKAEKLGSEYVVAVKGIVRERQSKNPNMPTGDIEIEATELRVLSKSETPPIYIKDNDNVSEDLRLKYRFLDLRKPSMQNNLVLRSKVANIVRNYLSGNNFVEIETPFLIKPSPEGARDYLVPSRVNPGKFYALPQSPQLFKQLLMVSGMDRYFQIVKCFRDEDLRADRQPEFTQIDCEMSFVDENDVMTMMENMIGRIFKEIHNIDIQLPLKRMTYKEAMDRFGSDKPDTRFAMELTDLSDLVKDCGFGVFSSAANTANSSVRAINAIGGADAFSKKGSGTPVIGNIPIVIPIFCTKWKNIIPAIPITTRPKYSSLAYFEVLIILIIIITKSIIIRTDIINPNSSDKTEYIKSEVLIGIYPSCV